MTPALIRRPYTDMPSTNTVVLLLLLVLFALTVKSSTLLKHEYLAAVADSNDA